MPRCRHSRQPRYTPQQQVHPFRRAVSMPRQCIPEYYLWDRNKEQVSFPKNHLTRADAPPQPTPEIRWPCFYFKHNVLLFNCHFKNTHIIQWAVIFIALNILNFIYNLKSLCHLAKDGIFAIEVRHTTNRSIGSCLLWS